MIRFSAKRLAGAAFSLMVSLSITGCSPKLERFSTSFLDVFDTASTIVAYTKDEKTFKTQTDAYKALLMEYHQLYDIYGDYEGLHNLKTVNDNAGIAPVEVDSRIIDLLKFGREMYELSDGKVNICFGSVLSVWHDYREYGLSHPEKASLPPIEELAAAAAHTDIDDLIIDEEASTVFLADPEMSLDVGSIAKGYAVEQVSAQIAESGLQNAAFSIGGNVYTAGWKEGTEGNPWIIGLEDPDRTKEDYLMTLKLSDLSVVTSGDYQRYYTVDGQQYHHIIDPDTWMPADYMHAVSVITEHSGYADGLSTTLFLMPVEDGLALVEGLSGVEAVWITNDMEIITSSGFDAYRNK